MAKNLEGKLNKEGAEVDVFHIHCNLPKTIDTSNIFCKKMVLPGFDLPASVNTLAADIASQCQSYEWL